MLDLLILTELKMPLAVPDPDPEVSGEPGLQKIFSTLWALVLSKNKEGGGGLPGLLPWIRLCFQLVSTCLDESHDS